MNKKIKLTIHFYGALRKYTEDKALHFIMPSCISLSNLRGKITAHLRKNFPDFNEDGLLDVSVFANETQILPKDTVLKTDGILTVLPPVCGG